MVAIVSGNGLGLGLTSKSVLGGQGVFGDASVGQGAEGVYVNAANGNVVLQQLQDTLAGQGGDISSILTYNSQGLRSDDNGDNFGFGFIAAQLVPTGTVNAADSSISVTLFDGSQQVYAWDGVKYVSKAGDGAFDTITYAANVYTRVDGATQQTETYNAAGQLTARTNAQGQKITFDYTPGAITVTNSDVVGGVAHGEAIRYVFENAPSPATGTRIARIERVADVVNGDGTFSTTVTQTLVSYAYDTSNRLSSVNVDVTPPGASQAKTYSTSFTYVGTTKMVQTMTQSDGTSMTFHYDASNRVDSIAQSSGPSLSFTYDTANRKTSVKSNGLTTVYGYDAAGQLTSVVGPAIDASPSPTTTIAYDADGNVTTITDPAGRALRMTYDALGNLATRLDSDGNLTKYTYDAGNRLLTQTTSTLATPDMGNLTGVTVAGGTMTKSGPNLAWDAVAYSLNGISGGAAVSFTAAQTTADLMVGLTADPAASTSYDKLDWAFNCLSDGRLMVCENGTSVDLHTTYVAGDVLSVRYDGMRVSYLKNGVSVRDVVASLDDPLYVASSFKTTGARVDNLRFGAIANDDAADIEVQGLPVVTTIGNIKLAGDTITRTNAPAAWDSSVRSVTGLTGGAAVSVTAVTTNKAVMIGLDSADGDDAGYISMDFAAYLRADGTLRAYRNGALLTALPNGGVLADYHSGDRVSLVYDGATTVSWLLNGAVVGTYTTTQITQPLYMDSSFGDQGGSVTGLRFGGFGAVDPLRQKLAPVMANAGGVSVTGGTIKKTGGVNGTWDASARSALSLSGGAQVGFSPATLGDMAVGLNSDPDTNASYSSLDYTFVLYATGKLEAWSHGAKVADLATYVVGDRLTLLNTGDRIVWSVNGVAVKSLDVFGAGLQAYYVDTSFSTANASISDLTFDTGAAVAQASPLPLARLSGTNVNAANGTVIKNAGTDGQWDAESRSINGIAGGAAVAFTAYAATNSVVVGLSQAPDAGVHYASIDYAMYAKNDGTLWAFCDGVQQARLGTYVAGDRLSVVYDGDKVIWLQNGKAMYSLQTGAIKAPLFADMSYFTAGAKITNLRFGSADMADPFLDVDAPPLKASSANAVVLGGDVSKGAGVDGQWDTAVRSAYAAKGGATISFTAGDPLLSALAVGLSTDATTGAALSLVKYGIQLKTDGTMASLEPGGVTSALPGTYAAGDRFVVSFDGGQVVFVKNGQVLRRIAVTETAPLYADATFQGLGARISDLSFTGGGTTDQTARYVYSADGSGRLRYTISAAGRVTEYTYSSAGVLSATNEYVQAAYNMAGLGSESVPSEADMNAWRAMQDRSLTQRTDIKRDWRQQVTGKTIYAATNGDGTGVGSGAYSYSYVYDPDGRLLSVVQGSATTMYVYDGLGRVVNTVDPVNRKTETLYDDAHLTITSTMTPDPASGSTASTVTTRHYDAAGNLLSVDTSSTDAPKRTTKFDYDVNGKVIRTTDPTGVQTWAIYDAAGRKVADVDGEQFITAYDYDASGLLTRQRSSATALSPAQMALLGTGTNSALTPKLASLNVVWNTSTDHTSWNVYDAAGRLRQSIDALGAVTQYDYDGAGRLVTTTQFATKLNPSGLAGSAVQGFRTLATSVDDRISRNFYDADGLVVAKLDPERYLTAYQYDGKGRVTTATRYATQIPAAGSATSLDQIQPARTIDDQRSVTLYDLMGRVSGQVDAEGYLTENLYDSRGNLVKATRYATQVGTSIDPTATVDVIRPQTAGQDAIRSYTYDSADRVTRAVDYMNTVSTYQYAPLGNGVVNEVHAQGAGDEQQLNRTYDGLGELTGELTGVGSDELKKTPANATAIWAKYGIRYAYDLAGRRIGMTDARGNTTRYFYDNDGRLRFTVDAVGDVQELVYDGFGQVTETRAYAKALASGQFPTGGLVSQSLRDAVAALGTPTKTATTYLLNGLVKSVTDAMGTVTTNATYDAFGDVLTRTVLPVGGVSRLDIFTYDHRGSQLTSELDDAGLSVTGSSRYDAFGRAVKRTDARGQVTFIAYDRLGQVIQQTDPLSLASTWVYDVYGHVKAFSNAGSDPTTYAYDRILRSTVATAPGLPATTTITDHLGRTTSVTDADGVVTSFVYDDDGHLLSKKVGQTIVYNATYDVAGNLAASQDALGGWTYFTYDAGNRLEFVIDPEGAVTRHQYDGAGREVRTTLYAKPVIGVGSNGAAVTSAQVQAVLPGTIDFSSDQVTTRRYDAAGRVTFSVDATGVVTKFLYGAGTDQPIQRLRYGQAIDLSAWTDITQDPTVSAGWSRDEVTRWTYDTLGRVTLEVDENGGVTGYAYDAAGHVTQTRRYATAIPSGAALQVNNDSVNNFAQLALGNYAANSKVTATVHFRGTTTQQGQLVLGATTDMAHAATSELVQGTNGWLTLKVTFQVGASSRDLGLKFIAQTAGSAFFDDVRVSVEGGGATEYPFDSLPASAWSSANGNVNNFGLAYPTPASTGTDAQLQALVASIADPARDDVVRDVYDADGRRTVHVDALGAITQTSYDAHGNVTRVRRLATPLPANYAGSDTDLLTLIGQTSGVDDLISTNAYDVNDRLIYQVDATGAVTQMVYDAAGHCVVQRQFARAIVQPTTNAVLGVSDIAAAINNADPLNRATRFAYDAFGRQILVVDASGSVTEYQYDAAGDRTVMRRYADAIDKTQMPANGAAMSEDAIRAALVADPTLDRITRYAYDDDHRLAYVVDPMGTVTGSVYDAAGNVTSSTVYATPVNLSGGGPTDDATVQGLLASQTAAQSSANRTTRTVYDAGNRPIYVIDPLGGVAAFTYDADGNVASRTDYAENMASPGGLGDAPKAAALSAWVAAHHHDTANNAYDRKERRFYDAGGRLRVLIDAAGQATEMRYSADGTQVQTIRYAATTNALPTNVWGALNALSGIASPGSDLVSEVDVDANGRTTDTTDASGVVSRNEYDVFGHLVKQTRALYKKPSLTTPLAERVVTTYVYDDAGRVLSQSVVAPGKPEEAAVTSYTYDAFGDKLTEVSPNAYALLHSDAAWAQSQRAYFGVSQAVTSLTDAEKTRLQSFFTTTYSYDGAGRVLTTTTGVNSGQAVQTKTSTTYDAFGDAVKVVDPRGFAGYFYFDKLGRVELQIDPARNLTATTYAPGLSDSIASVRRYFVKPGANTYSETSRPAVVADDDRDAITSYVYDLLGRVTSTTQADKATEKVTYSLSVKDGSITFSDRFDKQVTNRLGGVASFEFDQAGNETRETLVTTAQVDKVVNTYVYDAFGNRTQMREGVVGTTSARTTDFVYDAMGRVRYRKGTSFTAYDSVYGTSVQVTPVDETQYDNLGRVIFQRQGGTWADDPNGGPGSATGGATTYNFYDAAGRLVASVAADRGLTTTNYDAQGNIVGTTQFAKALASAPNLATRPTPLAADSTGSDRTYVYTQDNLGRRVVTQVANLVWWEAQEASDHSLLTGNAHGPELITLETLTYDLGGNVVQRMDGRGNSVFTYYDVAGRKRLQVDEDGYATRWEYDDLFDTATQQIQYATSLDGVPDDPYTSGDTSVAAIPYLRQGTPNGGDAADWTKLETKIAALPAAPSGPTRTTLFAFDRMGRVSSKTVKSVAYSYVDPESGAITASGSLVDAVTTYTYDGLGNLLTQKDPLTYAGGVLSTLDTTYTYDLLGRLVRKQDAQFKDAFNNLVSPTTDITYDALGNRASVIQRGATAAADRTTSYKYDANGNLVQEMDGNANANVASSGTTNAGTSNGRVTKYEYDAGGRVSRTTVAGLQEAGGGSHDVVTTYRYDAMGRETQQVGRTDGVTDEIRNWAYTVFGEVRAKGLGQTVINGASVASFQEFTYYNVLGKVERSDTGDGTWKAYVYDRNGNTTKQLVSFGASTKINDLSKAFVDIANDNTFAATYSMYDGRNHLIRTVEPDITYDQDRESLEAAYSQHLTDPLSGAGVADGGASGINSSGFGITQVTSSDGNTSLSGVLAAVTNGLYGGVTTDATIAVGTVTPTKVSLTYGHAPTEVPYDPKHPWNSNDNFTLPSSFPTTWQYQLVKATGEVFEAVLVGQQIGIGDFSSSSSPLSLQAKPPGAAGYTQIATIYHHFAHDSDTAYENSGSTLLLSRFLTLPPLTTGQHLEVYANYGTASQSTALLTSLGGSNTYALDPGLSGKITILVTDSSGVLSAVDVTLAADGSMTYTPHATGSVWLGGVGAKTINFAANLAPPAQSTALYYRVPGQGNPWSSPPKYVSNGSISSTAFAAGTYEYLLDSPAGKLYGTFVVATDGSVQLGSANGTTRNYSTVGVANTSGALTTYAPQLTFNFGGTLATAWGSPTSYAIELTIAGKKVIHTVASRPTGAAFDLTEGDFATLGFGLINPLNALYRYRVFANDASGTQLLGEGDGQLTLGAGNESSYAPAYNGYRPLAHLDVATGTPLRGTIVLSNGSKTISIPVTDRRIKSTSSATSTHLDIDLSDFVDLGGTTTISYNDTDAGFTGTYEVSNVGVVKTKAFSASSPTSVIPLTIPAATTLSVLKVGSSDSTLGDVVMSRVTQSPASTFNWNAVDQSGLGDRRFYYETKNADGKVIAKNYGSITVDATGKVVKWSLDSPPTMKAAVAQFSVPATTATFSLTINGKKNDMTVTPGQPVLFDAVDLRPTNGVPVDYAYTYTGADASGIKVTGGTGTLHIAADGTVTNTVKTVDRAPIAFKGPKGETPSYMRLQLTTPGKAPVDVILKAQPGLVDGCEIFLWDAVGYQPAIGAADIVYDSTMTMLTANSNDAVYKNAAGRPIVISGQLTVGSPATGVAALQEWVSALSTAAQVSHNQTWNAFGEIDSEFDDATAQRAQNVLDLYWAGQKVDASSTKDLSTTFTYNALGQMLTKRDPLTTVTDEHGGRTRANAVTTYAYDLSGRLSTITDANGNRSKQSYAGAGDRVSSQWAADGARRRTDYDVLGDAVRTTDELNFVTTKLYDHSDNLIEVDELGVTRVAYGGAQAQTLTLTDTYVYDAMGQRIKHTNAAGFSDTTDYDGLGRVTQMVTAGGAATTYTYAFIAMDKSEAESGILGNDGVQLGGYRMTTLGADGRTTIDWKNYFGQISRHQDEAGHNTYYRFGRGGTLDEQFSKETGQRIDYAYYDNGAVREAKDQTDTYDANGAVTSTVVNTLARYGYDNAGNRAWEQYSGWDAAHNTLGTAYQSSTIYYDELNRLLHVQDDAVDVQYEYDAVGNRRSVQAVYWDQLANVKQVDSFWYTYDKTNRFTMTKGALSGVRGDSATTIVQGDQGVALTYDARSQRKTATHGTAVQTFSYSTDGFVENTLVNGQQASHRTIDKLGRTTEYVEWSTQDGGLLQDQLSTYDNDGRVLTQTDVAGATKTQVDYLYYSEKTDDTTKATKSGNGALAMTQQHAVGSAKIDVTKTTTYQYWDDAKEKSIVVTGGTGAGRTNLTYDADGFLKSALIYSTPTGGADQFQRRSDYVNASNGLVLQRKQSGSSDATQNGEHDYYYAGDRLVGDVSTIASDGKDRVSYAEQLAQSSPGGKADPARYKKNSGSTSTSSNARAVADFDQNYQPINAGYPAATSVGYTVRDGDTLRSIAQTMWGDADMWYLIAQANNLAATDNLVEGQLLVIPNKVTNIHNNASTFKPYNPGEVIGHIDPTLPDPPPPPAHGGCGAVGMILMVVVAVVVTIYTAGAAAAYLLPEATAGMSTFAAGVATLGGQLGFSAAAIGAAAIGGAAGSIASQAVGNATGDVKGFSWKQVATSAIGAGITAGVGAGLNQVTQLAGPVRSGALQAGGGTGASSLIGATRGLAQAVGASAIEQGIRGEWSWRQVAAAAVGSEVGQFAGAAMGEAMGAMGASAEFGEFAKKLASGFAGSAAQGAVLATDPRYTKASLTTQFISSLGGTLGQTLVEGGAQNTAQQNFRQSEMRDENALGNVVSSPATSENSPALTPNPNTDPAEFAQLDFVQPSGLGGPTLDPNFNGGNAPRPGQVYTDAGWWNPDGQENPDDTVQLADASQARQSAAATGSRVYRDADGRLWIGDGTGKQRAQGDNPAFVEQRQADQDAFLATVPEANAAADAKAWAAFEKDANATATREGQEAQAAADFAKRTGVPGMLLGANDFGVGTFQAPIHLAESVYDNGVIPTVEQMVEGLVSLPGQFITAASAGDMRTATAAGLGLFFLKMPEGEAGTTAADGLRLGGDTLLGKTGGSHIPSNLSPEAAAVYDEINATRAGVSPRLPRDANPNISSIVRNSDGTSTVTIKSADPSLNGLTVNYSAEGFPDYSPYLNQDGVNTVQIKMTGSRNGDFAAANRLAGYGETANDTPIGYTWHHNEDLGLMQLVNEDVHALTPHTGGVAIWQRAFGISYDGPL